MADDFMKMKTKYGSVMSVQIGLWDCVILNDYDAIYEALVKQGKKFSGRPNNVLFDLITQGCGIVFIDYGQLWGSSRRFGSRALKGFGVGKKEMERNVREETFFLIESLTRKEDRRSLLLKLTSATSNIICRLVLGTRFDDNDKRIMRMTELLHDFFAVTTDSKLCGLVAIASFLRFIPPFSGSIKRAWDDTVEFSEYIRDIIDEKALNFNNNDIRNVSDEYVGERISNRPNDLALNQIIQLIRDLFEAGTGTTTNSLYWAILCFAHYTECQDKIAEEIERTVGEDGVPTMKHRDEMPYTCAFIQELMRHRTLLPLSVFHKTIEEATLNGYTIQKNATVFPNIWSVHFDPKYFENPREFRPERFLDNDGKFIKSTHVIPFCIGPRHCLGEQLARMEMFIFLTGIVQKLKVVPDQCLPVPPFDVGRFNILAYEARDFDVIFERR
ncbi:cytochrome P450 2U1-like [Styela clava]